MDLVFVSRRQAERWASVQGFSSSQLAEFNHLLQTALSRWIPKRSLRGSIHIDSGSFGKIYRSSLDGQEVAVKEIGQSGGSSLRSKMTEISLELCALVLVDHPHCVKFQGATVDFAAMQPSISLVFEMCSGGSLHKHMFEFCRPLSVGRKVQIGSQVASGLAYLHSQHILHRDLNTRCTSHRDDGAQGTFFSHLVFGVQEHPSQWRHDREDR